MSVVETASGVDKKVLLADLRKQLGILEDDLRERAAEEQFDSPLRKEYEQAKDAKRTAATYETWLDGRVTQAAVGWILGCVFVRFCEDNGLIAEPYLAGPGDRLAVAQARHEQFFRDHPHKNDRDWIEAAFDRLSDAHPTAAGLFDRAHNALWEITPSYEAASALLRFWRRLGPDGKIVHDFTDAEWNTRFLGDLYQDLSEAARKTYALLQTPEFVEEFILDLTLEPAVEEFGLEPTVEIRRAGGEVERALQGLRTIDPACGSGHFLLGIFHRLLDKWRDAAPGVDDWELIRRSMESVHGCDKNPFAVSIARFRLLVAALRAGGARVLDGKVPGFPIKVATGDSLIHGRGAPGIQGELFATEGTHTYATEDVNDYVRSCDLLGRGSYHVVVGNPPFIEVKGDRQEKSNYKLRYPSCSGLWVLTVPFFERFFQLGVRSHGSDVAAGYIGKITGNGFMKHEFGRKLIERYVPTVHLTHVIDTSGVNIPGHGTPTVIIFGRNHIGRASHQVRTISSAGEGNSRSDDARDGALWREIVAQSRRLSAGSTLTNAADLARETLYSFPWSIMADSRSGIASKLSARSRKLSQVANSIGYTGQTNSDDAFLADPRDFRRFRLDPTVVRDFTTGDDVREWQFHQHFSAIFPYDSSGNLLPIELYPSMYRRMWPLRTQLWSRVTFSGPTYREDGRPWWSWHQVAKSRLHGRAITWPVTETYPHFAYMEECRLHNRHAPIIQLSTNATPAEYCGVVGVLNSSSSSFWLRQVCHNKGEGGGSRVEAGYSAMGTEPWKDRYEFTGTKLQEFPLPAQLPLDSGQTLDSLAQELAIHEPSALATETAPTRERLDAARTEHARVRGRVIALQEELDWEVYQLYGLLTDSEAAELRADPTTVPELKLGERAFEIVLARKVAAGEAETAWFARHGSTPITEVLAHWPEPYRQVVAKRIETVERHRDIALIERPECKRRWATESWEKKERDDPAG